MIAIAFMTPNKLLSNYSNYFSNYSSDAISSEFAVLLYSVNFLPSGETFDFSSDYKYNVSQKRFKSCSLRADFLSPG